MGTFITFEGTEGSGKTTQIALLADALRERHLSVVVTREPGGTPLGDALRALLLERDESITSEAEAYLMTGARAEHVRKTITPALQRGETVLCDSFSDSTLAYQGAGRGLPIDSLRAMQSLAVGDTVPVLTVLLDVDVREGLRRRHGDGNTNRIDRELVTFHERVATWYRDEAARDPDRWAVFDATHPPDVVHTAILKRVCARLAVGTKPAMIGVRQR